MDVNKLTTGQRAVLRKLNEEAAGPELVHSLAAKVLIEGGFAERAAASSGRRGFTLLRLTAAGVAAANDLRKAAA